MAILKNVANILSGSRIIISFLLLFFQAMSVPFLILYACCGVTDMLDGAIALKTNTESKLGATLDSIADLVMVVVVLVKLIPEFVDMDISQAWDEVKILFKDIDRLDVAI